MRLPAERRPAAYEALVGLLGEPDFAIQVGAGGGSLVLASGFWGQGCGPTCGVRRLPALAGLIFLIRESLTPPPPSPPFTQLAACAALRALVDDWTFEEAPFVPYVPPCLELLLRLLLAAAEFDTQLQARARAPFESVGGSG